MVHEYIVYIYTPYLACFRKTKGLSNQQGVIIDMFQLVDDYKLAINMHHSSRHNLAYLMT